MNYDGCGLITPEILNSYKVEKDSTIILINTKEGYYLKGVIFKYIDLKPYIKVK